MIIANKCIFYAHAQFTLRHINCTVNPISALCVRYLLPGWWQFQQRQQQQQLWNRPNCSLSADYLHIALMMHASHPLSLTLSLSVCAVCVINWVSCEMRVQQLRQQTKQNQRKKNTHTQILRDAWTSNKSLCLRRNNANASCTLHGTVWDSKSGDSKSALPFRRAERREEDRTLQEERKGWGRVPLMP